MISNAAPTVEKPPKAQSPRLLIRAAVVMLILIAAGLAVGLFPRFGAKEVIAKATRELNIPTVSVTSPVAGAPGLSSPLSAEIQPFLEAAIYARASGYLKRRLVDIGDEVKSGQLLAEIDTPELDQQLAQAKAGQAQAEAALRLSKITADRWAELIKTSSVSEQEAAEKQADYELKQANLDSAKASVRNLQELKTFASVTAPFDGSITARSTDDGQLITAAGHELFHLARARPLRIFARVPQTLAVAVKTGSKAQLTLSELPGRKFESRVVRTAGVIDSNSRTLLVELQSDNESGEILAGSYGQIQFIDSTVPTLTLSASTLLFRSDGVHVGVVNAGNKAEVRAVKLGRDFGQTLEILEGVAPGDRVIINPPDSLSDGADLRVK
jgi:membrane fusion protein (multidrug efflux system)